MEFNEPAVTLTSEKADTNADRKGSGPESGSGRSHGPPMAAGWPAEGRGFD